MPVVVQIGTGDVEVSETVNAYGHIATAEGTDRTQK
jgi:hypothetical protein